MMTNSTSSNEYKWSTYECIVLVQAFLKFGEDHWKDISRILTKNLESEEGKEVFSQTNCQQKFNSLLNEYIKSEEKIAIIPKVKQLTNKLLQKRSRQLQDELELNRKNFLKLKKEIHEIKEGKWDSRLIEELNEINQSKSLKDSDLINKNLVEKDKVDNKNITENIRKELDNKKNENENNIREINDNKIKLEKDKDKNSNNKLDDEISSKSKELNKVEKLDSKTKKEEENLKPATLNNSNNVSVSDNSNLDNKKNSKEKNKSITKDLNSKKSEDRNTVLSERNDDKNKTIDTKINDKNVDNIELESKIIDTQTSLNSKEAKSSETPMKEKSNEKEIITSISAVQTKNTIKFHINIKSDSKKMVNDKKNEEIDENKNNKEKIEKEKSEEDKNNSQIINKNESSINSKKVDIIDTGKTDNLSLKTDSHNNVAIQVNKDKIKTESEKNSKKVKENILQNMDKKDVISINDNEKMVITKRGKYLISILIITYL
ncbi:hypothetical protein H8356DRAFT_162033 [Neocallimastix lanati (nom. inval.)]|nr:hypothetical protein H8356DRAFT_162033 [Neocallimastix sp. JGI-2020a]